MLEDIEKYMGMLWVFRLKIFHIYIFYKPSAIGKHKEDIGGHWKGPQNYIFTIMKNIKKDIWVFKISVF
jgi:hypothetical protein